MAWTTEQYKAIAAYAKRHEYRMQMASSVGLDPKAAFLDKDGREIKVPISEVVLQYQVNKKEEAKERRRIKQEEERNKPWHQRFKKD